ncbi:hypothetical protein LWI28_016491 [Acer negundo]|uniref:RNase H type-1 domain-containing protein n=1 Tax=Acer negundo TaxID=4023 RepID=A0AAD5P5E6_ACENE|nr:hypothetical protein LWI28_016491 [Acer negundo]
MEFPATDEAATSFLTPVRVQTRIRKRLAKKYKTPRELLALHEGLILAKQHVVNGCWAEADAVNVVAAVNNCEPTNGVAGFLIDDVNALFADVQVFKCQDILRNENSFTHNLTLVDVYSKKIQLWQDICFRDLLNVLS